MIFGRATRGFLIVLLALFCTLMAAFFPSAETLRVKLGLAAFINLAALAMLKLIDGRQFDWAFRIFCGAVFLVFAGSAVEELLRGSVASALAGLCLLGLPALFYAWRGQDEAARS